MSSSSTEFVRVRCPGCDVSLKLKGAVRPGKRVKCPKCEASIAIPEPALAGAASAGAISGGPKQQDRPVRKKEATEDDWLDDLDGLDDTGVNLDNTAVLPPRVGSTKPKRSKAIEPRKLREQERGGGGFFGAFGPLMMSISGGLIGGFVGAAIWATIIALTEYEIGWIAWAVGALAGIGVRLGSNGEEGPWLGILSVLIAFASIYAGKAFGLYFLAKNLGQIPPDANPMMFLIFCFFAVPFIMGLFDILWFGLAGFTAFRIGSGLSSDD